ncbi:hypothetical protein BV22DRAFT_595660 [Leucogyrophana mollusca]|uniref:Uncharacterized protein n=1 Tax=Leucogyrophana mollusca TaxID=85980 RepID=A0ACB8BC64_9AGAM|nr:hypothetical protein BV22DRAFT_595660 [Leucogyrophana mollusca]
MLYKLIGITAAAAAAAAQEVYYKVTLDLYDGLSLHGSRERYTYSFDEGPEVENGFEYHQCFPCRDHTDKKHKPDAVDNRLYSFKFTMPVDAPTMYIHFYNQYDCKDILKPEFALNKSKTVNVAPPSLVGASSHQVCQYA